MSGSFPDSGGVNASIPLQAGRGVQQNPLASNPEQFANTLNSFNQLKMFPGQQQLQGIAIQRGQIENQTAQLQQNLARLKVGINAVTPLLFDKNGNAVTGIDAKDIARTLADMSDPDSGVLTAQQAAGLLQTVPDSGRNLEKNLQWVRQRWASMQSTQDALTALGRGGANMDNGQQIQPGTVGGPLSQDRGFQPAGQATQTFPSRATGGSPVTWTDKNNQPQSGTLSEFWRQQNLSNTMGPAFNQDGSQAQAPSGSASSGGQGGVIGSNGQPVGPQNPPRLSNTGATPSGGGTGPIAGPPGGLPALQNQYAAQIGTANARAANFQSDMFPLTQAMTALQAAPTGKGSQAAHDVSSYLNTFAPPMLQKALSFISPIMTPAEVTAYDEAKKYLTQGTLGSPGATRSNEGLSTAGAASPNTEISKEAAQLVLRGMVGLRRMEQEATLEFNNSGQAPGNYGDFQSRFATKADPRVYTFDLMDPAARAKLVQGMTPAARAKFWDQVHTATQNGILTPPSAPNG